MVGLLVGCSTGGSDTDWWMPMNGPMHGMRNMHSMMGSRAPTDAGPAATFPDVVEITVEAGDMRFDPTTREIVAGEPVNLTLTHRGQLFHNLETTNWTSVSSPMPVRPPPVACSPSNRANTSVPGHAAARMRGALSVHLTTP